MSKNSHAVGLALGLSLTIAASGVARAQTAPPISANAAQYLSLGTASAFAFRDSSSGSALAQITQAQNGGASAPAPALAAVAPPLTTTGPALLLQTAMVVTPASFVWSFAPAHVEPAIVRGPLAFQSPPGPDPSLFGSVALRIGHTALDGRWTRVAYAPPPTDARWREVVRAASALPEHARLQLANTWINHQIAFESDLANYGVRDYWASARESLARGRGDCEDYAIAKMELLRAAGVPQSDLYLVVAKDLVRRADHAILAVRTSDGFFVLDNGTDEVLPADAVQDYRPVVTFSAGREWLHGFRRTPDLMLASASRLAPASAR
jgi:predicted transglutaminase-like cysteine proteinase